MEWCLCPDQGLPRPDIVFQLDADIDKIKKRDGFGEEKYETEEFQKRVQKAFQNFHKFKYWNIIDANQDVNKIHQDITAGVEKLLKEYSKSDTDEFKKNFYPNSIGEDLFMYPDV